MTITVAQLDLLPEGEAAFRLAACCGSSRWVEAMLAARPFGERGRVFAASDAIARGLERDDWLEAFSHHPQIGGTRAAANVGPDAAEWSKGEQAHAASAGADVQSELVHANQEYFDHFGYIFIICASGLGAEQVLAAIRERMTNSPPAELTIAAREQQMITRLRLNKLLVG